jgi:drug/metabolite transporter (DMT)-like permease
MRLSNHSLSFVINFLLGVSWATFFLAGISTFFSYYSESLISASFLAIFASLPGLFMVLILEHIITMKSTHHEIKKQTKLLEAILSKD